MRRPKIVIRQTATGWKVSGTVNRQMRRKQFGGEHARELALNTKHDWEREIAGMERLPLTWTLLTDEQCREAEACYHRLKDHPLTLTAAVDLALANIRQK